MSDVYMLKKCFLICLLLLLTLTSICFASDSNERDFQNLEQIFREVELGMSLPDVKYLYLPKSDGNRLKRYEGHLGRVELTVTTQTNSNNEDIVKSYCVAIKDGVNGEEYLSLIVDYFGKPTSKIEKAQSNTHCPVYIRNGSKESPSWILFAIENGVSIIISE